MFNLNLITVLIFLSALLTLVSIVLKLIGFIMDNKIIKIVSFAIDMTMYITIYSAWLHYVSQVTAFNGYIVMFYSCLIILYFFYSMSFNENKV